MATDLPENQPLLVGDSSDDEDQGRAPDVAERDGHSRAHSNSINSNEGDPQQSVVSGKETTKIYKRRWYILLLFSLFSGSFSTIWNCWGPISAPAEAAFDWSDSTIALQTNLGPMAYMVSGFVLPWILQEKGLRMTVLGSVFIMSIGTSLRSITSHPPAATVLISMGQGLNGLIGPMAMAAIPQVSSVWFPPHERVTATSISNSFCIFGYAMAYLIGPALVSDVNSTTIHNHSVGFFHGIHIVQPSLYNETHTYSDLEESKLLDDSYDDATVDKARTEIMRYMRIECGWTWLMFIAMLIYFPAQPPLPPGLSAVAERDNYWAGLWSLKGKFGFLMVAFSYGISTGVTAGWAALLSVTLRPFGVSLDESGWIGFYSITGACIISLLLCRFADYFIRRIKLFILLMYTLGTTALLVFALMTVDVIAFDEAPLYLSIIAGFTLTNGAIPLLFELACELAYPTSESAANGFLTFLNNFFCLIFLLILSLPSIGSGWMNWAVMGCTFVCIPMIAVLKSKFNRLDLDETEVMVEADVLAATFEEGNTNASHVPM